mmetsp:Transcript_108659/g.350775  ORF Transcript_108659/g.350775 Transcript_108659/m.350775 type:complete len:118 (+) Transcript_108659:48-401(+)
MILQPPAEPGHTVLLRSDGRAVACGVNSYDQCTLPTLDAGVRYAQASAGDYRTVFLCSDGIAVACGGDTHGQYELLALDEGMTYVQVSAASQPRYDPHPSGSSYHARLCLSRTAGRV